MIIPFSGGWGLSLLKMAVQIGGYFLFLWTYSRQIGLEHVLDDFVQMVIQLPRELFSVAGRPGGEG